MPEWIDLLRHALWASLWAGVVCGIVGAYLVVRRMVFLGGGISHAAFGGVGLAHFLGIPPLLGASLAALLAGWGISARARDGGVRSDSAIGMIWSLGMAAGVILIHMTPGYAADLMAYLFGDLLTVGPLHVELLGIMALLVLGTVLLAFPLLRLVAHDEDFARSRRVPVAVLEGWMIALAALTIVVSIRVVGIVLVLALLTIPQALAGVVTRNLGPMMAVSVLVSWLSLAMGLALSFLRDWPAGPSVVCCAGLLYGGVRGVRLLQKRLLLRRYRQ